MVVVAVLGVVSIGVGGEKEKGEGEVMGVRGNAFGRPACAGPAGWLCVCWGGGGREGNVCCVAWSSYFLGTIRSV